METTVGADQYQNDSASDMSEMNQVNSGGIPSFDPWYGFPGHTTTCHERVLKGEAYAFAIPYLFTPEQLIASGNLWNSASVIIKFYISPFVLIWGILTNLVFLFVIGRVSDMRTVTNFYLGSLAVSDLIFQIISGIEIILTWLSNPGMIGHEPFASSAQCVSFHILVNMTFYSSVCLVSLVTFERYMAICHSLKHRMLSGRKWTIKITALSLTIASLLAVISSLTNVEQSARCILWPTGLKELLEFPLGDLQTFCHTFRLSSLRSRNNMEAASSALSSGFFVVNMFLNVILYALIVKRLSQRDVSKEGNQQGQDNVQRVRNQVAKMLIINGTVFFLLNITYEFYNFCWAYGMINGKGLLEGETAVILRFYGNCFRYLNSAVNPLIYGLSNLRYRKAFLKAFGIKPKGKAETHTTSVTAISSTNAQTKIQ